MNIVCFKIKNDNAIRLLPEAINNALQHDLFSDSRRVIRGGVSQDGELELTAKAVRMQDSVSEFGGKQRQNLLRIYRLGLPGRQEFFRLHPDKFLPDALARCARFITDKLHEKMRRASFFTACQRSVL